MSYYGILLPAYTGHLNPMTVLARALDRRGHRTSLIAPLAAEAAVRRSGLRFIPIAAVEFPPGEWERTAAEGGGLSGLRAGRFYGRWLARLARGVLRDLPQIIAREQFDGLVMDQILFGAEAVCEVLSMPLAIACNSLLMHAEPAVPPMVFSWPYATSWSCCLRNLAAYALQHSTGWPVLKEIVPHRIRHRLGPPKINHMNVMPPSLVQVTQLPAFLDFPRRRLPKNFHYTAPWLDSTTREEAPFPWNRLDGRPLVYASFGTLQNQFEHVFSMIAQAGTELNVQMVLALGRNNSTETTTTSSDSNGAIVVGYAPQLALLNRAAVVITHAGLNTTLEALSAGLPLLALPIANDQPGVAARIQRLGAGEFIPVRKISPGNLRRALESLLHTPDYRNCARKCADQLRALDGPARAAALIETAFSTRKPVYRSSRGDNASSFENPATAGEK